MHAVEFAGGSPLISRKPGYVGAYGGRPGRHALTGAASLTVASAAGSLPAAEVSPPPSPTLVGAKLGPLLFSVGVGLAIRFGCAVPNGVTQEVSRPGVDERGNIVACEGIFFEVLKD